MDTSFLNNYPLQKREAHKINQKLLIMCSQQGICFVNHLMILIGALMRAKATLAIPAQQKQHGRIVASIHMIMPSSESTRPININGRPMTNPRGRQSSQSQHILTPAQIKIRSNFRCHKRSPTQCTGVSRLRNIRSSFKALLPIE